MNIIIVPSSSTRAAFPYPKRLWALVYANIKHRKTKIDLISYNRSHLFIAVCSSHQIPLQTE